MAETPWTVVPMMMQPGSKGRWGKGAGKQGADLEFGAGMAEFTGETWHHQAREEKKKEAWRKSF